MNILFCYDKPIGRKFGGVASVSYTIMEGLQNRGHLCYCISATRATDGFCKNQYFLPIESKDDENEENKQWFVDFVKNKQIDVIINQNALERESEWPLLWSQGLEVKRITVYHNSLFSLYSCNNKRISENIIIRNLHLMPILDKLWRRLFRIKYGSKFKRSIKYSDYVVLLSPQYFNELSWFSGIKPDSHFVSIPNPALERFDLDINKLEKRNEVVFVGRLCHQKNLEALLNIWGIVGPTHPLWNLYIVGDGELRQSLESIVVKKKLTNVSFEGFKDPLDYYKNASIFCLTSKFEGFGTVLVESMNCGCVPVVFNSYACASDIIDNESNGFLIKPFDIDNYSKRLGLLMNNLELRKKMSYACKEKSKQFSLEIVLNKWEDLFYNRDLTKKNFCQ